MKGLRHLFRSSEFEYETARASKITLRRVGKLCPQPVSLRQAYGEPGTDIDIQSSAHCPGERIIRTAQAKAVSVEVRTAKQDMPEGRELGANWEAHDRPK